MMAAWVLRSASASGAALHIFNVSSGAAHKALPGWALYCSTKAALEMLTQALAIENPEAKIASVNPGIMDTPMQAHIRSASELDFPLVEHFRHYHKEQLLVPPATIARLLMEADEAGDFQSGEILRIEDRFNAPRNKN
jgi:NAD(P)-dependent dehydrogenase (short-subunit alcohol dehydrogenase family)